jgi:tetratricopeptide (TPR) repeat protein
MGMTLQSHTADRTPPRLSALFTEYLQGQTAAHAQGLGYAPPSGEVEPYESVPVQPVDPRQAWTDALAATEYFPGADKATWTAPTDWPMLVGAQEPALALAFCLGNFPQMVRNLHPLLAGGDLTALRAEPTRVAAAPMLIEWARSSGEGPQTLLAAGVLRLANQFDAATDLLRRWQPSAEWRAVYANEEAALAWHRGSAEEAAALWRAQAKSVPVLFNRGMAALFLGDAAAAREALTHATAALPETGAWHHLGRLYLALAARRRPDA